MTILCNYNRTEHDDFVLNVQPQGNEANRTGDKLMTTTYSTVVVSPNTWHADGSPVVERDCGHKHTTVSGACRCHAQLTKRQPGGTYRADFYNATVRHSDGSALNDVESDAVYDFQSRI